MNGVVRAKYLEMRGRGGGEGGDDENRCGCRFTSDGGRIAESRGRLFGEGGEIKQGGESENRRQK